MVPKQSALSPYANWGAAHQRSRSRELYIVKRHCPLCAERIELIINLGAIQREYNSWFNISRWNNPCAVTLTLKKAIVVDHVYIQATADIASNALRHMLNVVNRQLDRPKAKKGWGIPVIPILETNAEGRLHYHLTVDRPATMSDQDFDMLLYLTWTSMTWGYHEYDFRPNADQRWVSYGLKYGSKPDYHNAIDLQNLRLYQ